MRQCFVALLLIVLSLSGCSPSPKQRITQPPQLQRVQYGPFDEAYRLSNGTVEVVVVPALGRIMRYGYIGQRNVLWENLQVAETTRNPSDWQNWGGDKVFVWPQEEWPKHTGRGWPPAFDPPASPYQVTAIDGGLRMTSPVISGYDTSIVRQIHLDSTGTGVTITNLLKRGPNAPVAYPWTITQIDAPQQVLARVSADAQRNPWKNFPDHTPWPAPKREGETIILNRPTDISTKIGLDVDAFAVAYDDLTFTQHMRFTSPQPRMLPAAEMGQVYSLADPPTSGPNVLPPYLELEFAAPHPNAVMEVKWQLQPVGHQAFLPR